MQYVDLGKNVILGAIVGVLWGWAAIAINAVSGVFPFEESLLYNMISFAVGGAVFGIVISGFLGLLQRWLPFKSVVLNAILLSVALWLILRIGGAMLSSVEPERYHLITIQSIQGFVLSVIMGCILGILWKVNAKRA